MKVDNSNGAEKYAMIINNPAIVKPNKGLSPSTGKKIENGFLGVLNSEFEKLDHLKFSAHAQRRLQERNVVLNGEDMRKIEGAVNKAAVKGSRESLVIYGDLALVASIRNKTIITAIEGKDMKDHIFTNIDSAVIVS